MILAVVALGLEILAGSLALTMGSGGLGASVFLVPIAAGLSILGLVYSVIGYRSSKRAAVLGIALCVTAGVPAVLISIMLIRGLLAGVSVPAIGVSLS